MSRSKNEFLLIALALFTMAAVCLCSVFNPASLKAVEVEGRETYQSATTEQTEVGSNTENNEGIQNKSNMDTPAPIADTPTGVININTASLSQLMTLDGIGETKAQAIIDYREEHGGFTSTQELTSVKGIGEKTFEKLKNNICI